MNHPYIPSPESGSSTSQSRGISTQRPAIAIYTPLALAAVISFEILGALGGHYVEKLRGDHAQPARHLWLFPSRLPSKYSYKPICWADATMLVWTRRRAQHSDIEILVTWHPPYGMDIPPAERPTTDILREAISDRNVPFCHGYANRGTREVSYLQSSPTLYTELLAEMQSPLDAPTLAG